MVGVSGVQTGSSELQGVRARADMGRETGEMRRGARSASTTVKGGGAVCLGQGKT